MRAAHGVAGAVGALMMHVAATPFGVRAIRGIVAPLDIALLQGTGGRLGLSGRGRTILVTTTGRRSGRPRTTPLFHVDAGHGRVAVCNVRPRGERANPWVLNVTADPRVVVQRGGRREPRVARRATDAEVADLWPRFVRLWPAYGVHLRHTEDRSMFVLEQVPPRDPKETRET